MMINQLFAQGVPELVMYDLDGTLVDSVPDITRSIDQMLAALGRAPAGESKVRGWVGNCTRLLVARALADGMDVEAVVPEELQAATDLYLAVYAQCNGRYSALYAGVEEALTAFADQGVRQVVVTNKPYALAKGLLEHCGLAHFFAGIVGGDSLPQQKPAPEPLLHMLNTHQVSAQHALMVGDSINDISAAKAAGVKVAAVTYGYNYGQPIAASEPDLVVDSIAELLL